MAVMEILHYKCFGSRNNPPIALLHGFMGSIRDWDAVVDALCAHFRCLVIDLPGHGQSTQVSDDLFTFSEVSQAIARVLDLAGVASAPFVGYSMGGRIALYLAAHHRRLCSALIIESATAGIPEREKRINRRALDEQRAQGLERGVFEEFLRTWYSQPLFSSLAQRPAVFEKVMKRRLKNVPKQLAKALRGFSVGLQPSLWDTLPSMDMPVLLITGKQDSTYMDLISRMNRLLPRAKVLIHPHAGHNVHVEDPVGFVKSVKDFLLEE